LGLKLLTPLFASANYVTIITKETILYKHKSIKITTSFQGNVLNDNDKCVCTIFSH